MKIYQMFLFIMVVFWIVLSLYFLRIDNIFACFVSLLVSSFFSSTRKYNKLKNEIREIKLRLQNGR